MACHNGAAAITTFRMLWSQFFIPTSKETPADAVVPSHQRRRIGSRLVEEGLRACRDAGHAIVLVLGHPRYYPRFGFSAKRIPSTRWFGSCRRTAAVTISK